MEQGREDEAGPRRRRAGGMSSSQVCPSPTLGRAERELAAAIQSGSDSGYSSTQLAAGWPYHFRVEWRRRPLSCIAAQQVPSAYRAQPTELNPWPSLPHSDLPGGAALHSILSRYRIQFNTGGCRLVRILRARTDGMLSSCIRA
jgi:hypothetical protein